MPISYSFFRIKTVFVLMPLWIGLANPPAVGIPPFQDAKATPETVRAAGDSEDSTELIRQAVHLTSEGQTADALALYQHAAAIDPAAGIPALGRFLALAGLETERREFIRELETKTSPFDPLTRGRGLLVAGERKRAVALLRNTPSIRDGRPVKGTLLLASLLRHDGNTTESDRILCHALLRTSSSDARIALFKELTGGHRVPLADSPGSFTMALDAAVASWHPTRNQLIDLLDPVVMALQSSPDYFARRDAFLALSDQREAATAWFVTRILIREERQEDALEFLEATEKLQRQSALWPLIAEEVAELHRSLGKHDEAEVLLESVARRRSGRDASLLDLKAAGLAFSRRDLDRALALLNRVDPESLRSDELRTFHATTLAVAAHTNNLPLLMDVYSSATLHAMPDDCELLHMVIFEHMQETEQHRALDRAVRERLQNDPKGASTLWRLDAETCVQLRSRPNQLKALYHLVLARPGDLNALDLLAREALPIAIDVVKAPSDALAVPPEEIDKLAEITEKSLIALIRGRPYDPTYMGALIAFYTELGDKEKAVAVPDQVAGSTTNPRLLDVAGYALSINGFPEQGLVYYDRALALDPDNTHIQMNRAGCLTRLDRWDEARAFYQLLLEQGVDGREYHVHELVQRLWAVEQHQEREQEGLAYFRSLDKRIQGDWVEEAWRSAAALMASEKDFDRAEEFYRLLRDRAETRVERAQVDGEIAMTYFKAEEFTTAEQRFREAAERYQEDRHASIEFHFLRAEALVRLGKPDEAIDLMRRQAQRYPALPIAYNGLYRAAQLAAEADKSELAIALYREFLDTPSTEFGRKREARQQIQKLESATAADPEGEEPHHSTDHARAAR